MAERGPLPPTALQTEEGPGGWAEVVHLFLELRGRGLSLSAPDYRHLEQWRSWELEPADVLQVLLDLKAEADDGGLPFPNGLAQVGRRLKRALKRESEY